MHQKWLYISNAPQILSPIGLQTKMYEPTQTLCWYKCINHLNLKVVWWMWGIALIFNMSRHAKLLYALVYQCYSSILLVSICILCNNKLIKAHLFSHFQLFFHSRCHPDTHQFSILNKMEWFCHLLAIAWALLFGTRISKIFWFDQV